MIDDAIGFGLRAFMLAAEIRVKAKLDPIVASEWPLDRYLTERRDDRAEKKRQWLAQAEARRLAAPSPLPDIL